MKLTVPYDEYVVSARLQFHVIIDTFLRVKTAHVVLFSSLICLVINKIDI